MPSDDGSTRSDKSSVRMTMDASQSLRHTPVRAFQLAALEGPATGEVWTPTGSSSSIGAHPSNDIIIDDDTVSRFHCEVSVDPPGPRVRDLDSRNGTEVDGVTVLEALLRNNSLLRLGNSVLRFEVGGHDNRIPLYVGSSFGLLRGTSVAIRAVFSMLERAAGSDAPLLLEGELGTGKESAARSVHGEGARRDGPFVGVDCGAIPPDRLEREILGEGDRPGAFERAHGGTMFLDEIGELPLSLQPAVLRVIERGETQRVGATHARPVSMRVIAAANRDLRAEVNAGRFRSDLYYRLAVVRIQMPPLRSRPDDLAALVAHILDSMDVAPGIGAPLRKAEFIRGLTRAAWPGNVRELRHYIERCVVLQNAAPIGAGPSQAAPIVSVGGLDPSVSYLEARRAIIDEFDRSYVEALLQLHQGNSAQAARSAGMDLEHLEKLLKRHHG